MNIYNESYKTVLLIVDSENDPGQLQSLLAGAGYRILVKSAPEIKGLLGFISGIRPVVTVIDIKSENNALDLVSSNDPDGSGIPVIIMTDEAERHQREIHGCPFYAVWLARVFSPDSVMASLCPYLRIGKNVLESDHMMRNQEKVFMEKIRNIEQNASKLNVSIEQMTSMNRHIVDECVTNRANSDILPPFLRLSPEVVAITRIADGKVIDVNDAVERVTGYTREYAMSTTTLREGLWAFSEDRAKMFSILFKEGKIHNFETRFRKKSGAIFPVLFSSAAIVYDNEPCIIAMFIDISERRRAEKLLDARLALSEAAFSNDTDLVFASALEQAERLTDSHISFFHRVSDSGKTLLIQAWSENTLKVCSPGPAGRHCSIEQAGIWADCVRERKPVIHNDYACVPGRKGLPDNHVPILRELTVPVFMGSEIVAVMGVGNKPWDYDVGDIESLSQIARMTHDHILRITVERELRESQDRFRAIFEYAAIGICQTDLSGRFINVNKRFCEITGYSRQEIEGREFISITHDEDLEKNLELMASIISGETDIISYEKRYIHKKGFSVWIHLSTVLIKDENQNPLYFITTIEDISSRKNAEYSLRKERDFTSAILDTSGTLLVVLDRSGNVVVFNRKCEDVSGYSIEEIQGRDFWNKLFLPGDFDSIVRIFYQLRQGQFPIFHESYWKTKSGDIRFISWNNTCILDDNGDVAYIIGAGIDITEKRKAEDALRESEADLRKLNEELELRVAERTKELEKARQAAETANRAKSSFLANMSHELRTPLNAILGFSRLMSHDPDFSEKQRKNINIINRSGEHLLQLINNILDMAKIESGHMPVYQVSFDIIKMLEDIENMFRLPASDRNNILVFMIDRHVPRYVSADEGKIRQILINLVGNSVKFTEKGSIRVSALLVIMQENSDSHDNPDNTGMLQLRVKDTGQGMSRDELDSVFRPFFQTRSGQKHSGGTGLGLSISRQFAVLMGGDLTAESSGQGLGSEFLLEIPVGLCVSSDMGAVRAYAPDVVSMLPPREQYRILIVEDVEENRSLLTELLAMWGLESRCAVNGREAVDMWHEWKPHLIFMDMRMPVMDGYEAIETIRSDTEEEQPVIVALTASTFEEQKLLILEKGADSFLSKPFLECDIACQLETHLGLRFIYADSYDSEAIYEHEYAGPDFAVMDTDWLARLSNAVSDADPGLINRLADEIRSDYPDAASFIKTCADNFDYEPIRINIEKCQRYGDDS